MMDKLIITVACDSRTSYPANHYCPPQEDIAACAQHAAATSRIPLGIVIVGGLLFSLVLTLFVIPSLYLVITGKRHDRVTAGDESESA